MNTSSKNKIQVLKTNKFEIMGYQIWQKVRKTYILQTFFHLESVTVAQNHIKLYIFLKNTLSSIQKCKINQFINILLKSMGHQKSQHFKNVIFRRSSEAWNQWPRKKMDMIFLFFQRIDFQDLENYHEDGKQGFYSLKMVLSIMALFNIQGPKKKKKN